MLSDKLNSKATYKYLTKDCGVDVTLDEASKHQSYFSPNSTGHWLNASFLAELPQKDRRDALFAAIEDFNKTYGKP